jgi:hypothetical protein
VAAGLTGPVSLTPPAAWAQWSGAPPTYAQDVDGCPRVADRLGALLGARWTYAYGTLPQGPYGCSWVPVPWVPDHTPDMVSIGYQTGDTAALLSTPDYGEGGALCPHLDVPAVAPGAVLTGCGDAGGYLLALPAPEGSGVWFLGAQAATGGGTATAAEELTALVDAASRAYG